MYQTDFAPGFSFEDACRTMGLRRARDLWAYYKLQDDKRDVESKALEECMARDAMKKDYRVNEELGGAPVWRMSKKSYRDIYRSSLNEKGATGGEFLEDENYMRWWLKRNPQCRIMAGSGKIVSGWTPQSEAAHRLARASEEARMASAGRLIAA